MNQFEHQNYIENHGSWHGGGPGDAPRNIAAEFRANIYQLQKTFTKNELPTLVVREERGAGMRVFDAVTKQQLPKSKPGKAWTVCLDRYFGTAPEAQNAADYLIALPIMAEALCTELERHDKIVAELKRQHKSALDSMREQKDSYKDTAYKLSRALHDARDYTKARTQFDSTMRRVDDLIILTDSLLNPALSPDEEEDRVTDDDYGRTPGGRPGRHDLPQVTHYTDEQREADAKAENKRRREVLEEAKQGHPYQFPDETMQVVENQIAEQEKQFDDDH